MDRYAELTREQLVDLILAQAEQIAALRLRVEQLEKQRDQPPVGSGSAAPTAPDWVKPNKPAKQKTQRKKRACAFTRPRADRPDRVVDHAPDRCPDCGRKLEGGTVHHTREVIDTPPVAAETVEHRFISRWCGVCGKRVTARADLSDQVAGKSRVGVGLTSLIAYLHVEARMPVRVLKRTLESLYGVVLSLGEISGLLERTAQAGAPIVLGLLESIRNSPMVHADETGWREDGQNGYLWCLSTPNARYYVRDPSRAGEVMRRTLGEEFRGRLVTDFYSAYSYYLGEHQRCRVHLLRDLHELKRKHPGSPSVEAFVERVRRVFDDARDFRDEDPAVRRKERYAFEERLQEVARPFVKRDVPQRVLAERILQFEKELFVFVEYPDTPPDDNAAERAIRPAVVARKVSGGTRSPAGSTTIGTLMSLAGTWRLRGQDVLECFRLLLTGRLRPDANPA